jgi:hypothetical protein
MSRISLENKSQSTTIDLTKRLGDLERVLKENSEKIMNRQIAAQAVEGLVLMFLSCHSLLTSSSCSICDLVMAGAFGYSKVNKGAIKKASYQ